ncbi:N-formylglutamate amidohydrolase [Pseudaestuariivita sp.]|uniref:N-formylglutamate amidohydrolase n=1 Tax=Pseudaestuariivita sp. TaxID=2211669 RepID=UPI00405A09C4
MTYQPFHIEGADRPARWLVTCDHATNVVPEAVGDLGLPEAEMARHISYDPGALGLSRALGVALDAPVISSNFSRLVIDPNRGEDDPTLVMRLYDGTLIPGNRHATEADIAARRALCYDPYHDALADLAGRRPDTALISVHSFTPQLKSRPPRPWEIGILSAWDRRLADPLLAALYDEPDLCVGDNEPYVGHLPGDAMHRHALIPGRQNVLLELRQDVIATPEQQRAWADRLAPMLAAALPLADAALR